jgi:hypothetical protein
MSLKTKTVRNTPADTTLPKVPLTIDGTTYFLAWDFNALAQADEMTGENLLQSLEFENISAKRLRTLLFLSLLKFQPEMTVEKAGGLGCPSNSAQVMKAIVEAYTGSMPEAEPGEKSPNAEKPESSN